MLVHMANSSSEMLILPSIEGASDDLDIEVSSEVEPSEDLSSISAIENSRNELVYERKDLAKIIEPPLLKACEEFYDKNIRTLSSSANQKDVTYGYAHLHLDLNTMSEENLKVAEGIAQELGNEIVDLDHRRILIVHFPLNNDTKASEIEESSLALAQKFKKQPMKWAPCYTVDDLIQSYGSDPNNPERRDPNTWIAEGYYYAEEEGLYYMSKEHFDKVKEDLP